MLRLASAEDCRESAELYFDIRQDTVPSVHSVEGIQAWLHEHVIPQGSAYVWELSGTIAGWINVRAGWVEHLFCRRGFTSQGLGSRMMEFAKSQSPNGLQLWTFQVNEGARRFYRRHGFQEVEFTDGSNNEENEPDVRLVWKPAQSPETLSQERAESVL